MSETRPGFLEYCWSRGLTEWTIHQLSLAEKLRLAVEASSPDEPISIGAHRGVGKSTLARMLSEWLSNYIYERVLLVVDSAAWAADLRTNGLVRVDSTVQICSLHRMREVATANQRPSVIIMDDCVSWCAHDKRERYRLIGEACELLHSPRCVCIDLYSLEARDRDADMAWIPEEAAS